MWMPSINQSLPPYLPPKVGIHAHALPVPLSHTNKPQETYIQVAASSTLSLIRSQIHAHTHHNYTNHTNLSIGTHHPPLPPTPNAHDHNRHIQPSSLAPRTDTLRTVYAHTH